MTKPAIRAIETVYNGYRFRSRLEARWAVFFDSLGVEYQYEPEGFDLDGVWYLPDFYIPGLDSWVEIKPSGIGKVEEDKIKRLVQKSQKTAFLFSGDCWPSCSKIGFYPKDEPIPLNYVFTFGNFNQALLPPEVTCNLSPDETIEKVFNQEIEGAFWFREESECFFGVWSAGYIYGPVAWSECDTCHRITLFPPVFWNSCLCGKGTHETGNEDIMDAYLAARQARFEHKNGKSRPNVV